MYEVGIHRVNVTQFDPHRDEEGNFVWKWNTNLENPTLTPSVNIWHNGDQANGIPPFRCHFFVRDGRIDFLSDCTHPNAGKTLDMITINHV